MNSAYSTCEKTLDVSGVLTPNTPCPGSQYCYLKYSEAASSGCTNADDDITDTIYGVCLNLSSSNAVCPVQ